MRPRPVVLLTDYAWPDLIIESEIFREAGFELIAGPARASPAEVIAGLCAEHQPAAIMTNRAPVSAPFTGPHVSTHDSH